jgi:hypothetical protein
MIKQINFTVYSRSPVAVLGRSIKHYSINLGLFEFQSRRRVAGEDGVDAG